jgi:type IV pilus assembly protein PilM
LDIRDGRYWVESYGILPLPPHAVVEKNIADTESVGDTIERLLNLTNPRSNSAAAAVASSAVITKVIEMDADMTDDEREVQIRLDAEQYIPYPLDEVSLDFEVIEISPVNPSRVSVLLVASRTENVDMRSEALELAGLIPRVIDVESYAIERAFSLIIDTLPGSPDVVAIFDIGHTMTTLSVLKDEKIIYSREQLFGGKQLTEDIQRRYGLSFDEAGRAKKEGNLPDDYEPEVLIPYMDAIVQQAARSLQFFYSSTQYNDVDHILLAGGNANIPGLARLVQEKLGHRVTIANPFLQMGFASQIDANQIENDAPSLLVACGLALRSFD